MAGPALAAHDRNGEPVDGLQQSYRGARVTGGGEAPAVAPDFFFHGAKPEATFDREPPTGSQPATQQTDPTANSDAPGDPTAAYWQGEYSGTLDGSLNIRWYWSTVNPIGVLIRVDAIVTVFADANADGTPQKDKIIGRANVAFSVDPREPQENISNIPVDGTATENLIIQVVPQYSDSGPLLTATYDSDDFPAGFQVLGAGEGAESPASSRAAYDGQPFRVQMVNVGRDAAEPTIGVNRDGTAFYAAGAFDALPAVSPRQLARTEVLRSRDGGLSWESVQPRIPGDVTTVPPTTLDPYVYVEEESGRMFNPELYAGCTYMQFSDDEGESYETSPLACGDYVNDHQTVFAGPPPPNLADSLSDPDFQEVLYYCFNRVVDANCGRSLDGGRSFDPALGEEGGIAFYGFDPEAGGLCGGLHGHIATDSEGRLFLPKGHCGFPWIGISEDGAETWQRVQVSDSVGAAAPHLSVAVDAKDNVFFAWWDNADRLPYLSTSTDHGKTWSKPLMIAPPGVHEVNFPVIYAGDEGKIAINFPGTTVDDPEDKTRPWNQYIVASTNALAADPLFVSTTANPVSDPIHRGDCLQRCAGMFDFIDVIVSPHDGDIWATATDTCTNDREDGEGEAEAVDCVTNPENKDGNSSAGAGIANDEEGYAIRQLSGPRLSAGLPPPDDGDGGGSGGAGGGSGGSDEASGEAVVGPGVTAPILPATGGGGTLVLLGAAALSGVMLVRRRR